MIKLNEKKLSSLEGQRALIAAIDLERKMGYHIGFQADPSFKYLFQTRLGTFPYSDDLLRIILVQDCNQYDTRNAITEWLNLNTHKVSTVAAVRDIMQVRDGLFPKVVQLAEHAQRLVCEAMLGAPAHVLVSCTAELTPRSWNRGKQPCVKPPASFLAYTASRPDHTVNTLHTFMGNALELCRDFYPDMARCLIHEMNKHVPRLLDGNATTRPLPLSSLLNHLEDYMEKPVIRGSVVSVTMHDPATFKVAKVLPPVHNDEN